MHPKDIIACLHKADTSVVGVATDLGLRTATVSMVINDKGRSRNVATYISGILEIPLNELWPDVYIKQYKHKVRAA